MRSPPHCPSCAALCHGHTTVPHAAIQLGVQDQLHHPQCCAGVQLGGTGAARGAREMSLSGGGGLLSCAERAVSGEWPWGFLAHHPAPRLAPWPSTVALCPPAHADTPAMARRWLCWCNPAHTPGDHPPHHRPACPQAPPALLPGRVVGAGAGPGLGRGLCVPGSAQAAGNSVWASHGVPCPSHLPREAAGGLQAPGSRRKLSQCLWLCCISRGAPAESRL